MKHTPSASSSRPAALLLRGLLLAMTLPAAFTRCASMMTPQGGPRDSLPPRLVAATPRMNDTGFTSHRIYLEFDEYVQLKDQQKEFFTSPGMKRKPSLSIRGRGVLVDIKDTLLENTTYVLHFGSTVRDNNEGNPLHGLQYVFSTGPRIDSMWMSGYTADALRADSMPKSYVYFFPADSVLPRIDSLGYDSTLWTMRPAAIARAETNGIFLAQNLKPIPYRVYAVTDKNDNQLYDAGTDLVGFIDSTFNPADMPPFAIWYDSLRLYTTGQPQIYFRMFQDGTFRRQLLSESERPSQFQALLRFGAPHPRIDTIRFDSIPSDRVLVDYQTVGRDTLALWFHMPAAMLPDTIKGEIVYYKHDSTNTLQSVTEPLRLFWRHIETKEEERKREKAERDRRRAEEAGEEYTPPAEPNPFSFKTDAGKEINPEHELHFEFEYPLVRVDTARFSLIEIGEDERMTPIPFTLQRDTAMMRRWALGAAWNEARKYALTIPAGALENVAAQQNDTLSVEFAVMNPEKYATLQVRVVGKSPESAYILQLLDKTGKKVLQELDDARHGTHTFRFVPAGEVRLRVVEDANANGRWDTGNLLEHRQPERVEMYVDAEGNEAITTKVNWEITLDADMNRLFAPVTMQSLGDQLEQREQARLQKWLEGKAERDAERRKKEESGRGRSSGGFGGMGLGGTSRQTLQL